jgi:hypothetical protein
VETDTNTIWPATVEAFTNPGRESSDFGQFLPSGLEGISKMTKLETAVRHRPPYAVGTALKDLGREIHMACRAR